MRNMSFKITVDQARAKTKDVTRRQAWAHLVKPWDLVQQIVKGQGLKKGEKVEKIHVIRIISVEPEPIIDIVYRPFRDGQWEVEREGFPEWIGQESRFVDMYCAANKCWPADPCNRIEFEYVENNAGLKP